jgi:filamentous hemagglutinin family protein
MLRLSPRLFFSIFCCSWVNLVLSFNPKVVLAQSVVLPADNPSQTIVTQDGNQINITGGSAVQQNLFHTFQQFNTGTPETVTFDTRSTPAIVNVLANVIGGNPSIINGQLSLIGSSANLFLINPTGILFGSNATLNLPGAFTATTATSVGFGDQWWNGKTGDYHALVSAPTGFRFSNSVATVAALSTTAI